MPACVLSDSVGTFVVDRPRFGRCLGWRTQTLVGNAALNFNGYPIASASGADTGRVTVAWTTATAGKVATYTGAGGSAGWVSLSGVTFTTYGSTFGGAYVDHDPLPANGCDDGIDPYCLTDQQLQNEIQTALTAKGPSPRPEMLN